VIVKYRVLSIIQDNCGKREHAYLGHTDKPKHMLCSNTKEIQKCNSFVIFVLYNIYVASSFLLFLFMSRTVWTQIQYSLVRLAVDFLSFKFFQFIYLYWGFSSSCRRYITFFPTFVVISNLWSCMDKPQTG